MAISFAAPSIMPNKAEREEYWRRRDERIEANLLKSRTLPGTFEVDYSDIITHAPEFEALLDGDHSTGQLGAALDEAMGRLGLMMVEHDTGAMFQRIGYLREAHFAFLKLREYDSSHGEAEELKLASKVLNQICLFWQTA